MYKFWANFTSLHFTPLHSTSMMEIYDKWQAQIEPYARR